MITNPTTLPTKRAPARHQNVDADSATSDALQRFASTGGSLLRDELMSRYERVVQWVVTRSAREPGHVDDLMQVGRIALLQALERYQPARGVRFTSYAIKIIAGNLKHYYRDRVAFIRVPRGLQELATQLPKTERILTHRLGRSPSDSEMAEFAGVPVSEVQEAQKTGDAYRPQSLQESAGDRGIAETLGTIDPDLESLVEFAPLHDAISRLQERQQFIMRRRYFDDWSQTRVASRLGISQMQVSRLERESLRKLRGYMADDALGGHAMAN